MEDLTSLLSGGTVIDEAFPATGQTTCWDLLGTVVPCAGTGHDGEILTGAALSYADNGDGTITDLNTGLMWEKKGDEGDINDKDTQSTWLQAFSSHIATLNFITFAGHNDWRLPNIKELHSILDFEQVTPTINPIFDTDCVPGCSILACSCTETTSYWTSTTYGFSPDSAVVVVFHSGGSGGASKASNLYVRAVRGGL